MADTDPDDTTTVDRLKAILGPDFTFVIDDPATGARFLNRVVDHVLDTYDIPREAMMLLAYAQGITETSRS